MRKLYSYDKVWNIEGRIYSFQNITLPVPIKPRELGFFVGALVIIFLLNKMIPPLQSVNFALKYLVVPYVVMKFFLKMKLDGKNPVRFILGYLRYLTEKSTKVQFFRPIPPQQGKVKIRWRCGTRTTSSF